MAKAKMSEKELLARDAKRNITAEIRRGMKEVRAGRAAREHHVEVTEALEVRMRSGFSQQKFADVLGVSARTLQEWEQTRAPPPIGHQGAGSCRRNHRAARKEPARDRS